MDLRWESAGRLLRKWLGCGSRGSQANSSSNAKCVSSLRVCHCLAALNLLGRHQQPHSQLFSPSPTFSALVTADTQRQDVQK
jgi:hypothetical protein